MEIFYSLLFAFLNHFFNLPGSIPVLGWLLIFNTLIAGLITSFINAKLLEPITRLSKAMKEVSQGDFEQHLETNSRIAEVGESYQSFNNSNNDYTSRSINRNIVECKEDSNTFIFLRLQGINRNIVECKDF